MGGVDQIKKSNIPDANPAMRMKAMLLSIEHKIAELIAPLMRFPGT